MFWGGGGGNGELAVNGKLVINLILKIDITYYHCRLTH
jgi:hypothetical protein